MKPEVTPVGKERYLIRYRARILHNLADEVSIAIGEGAYANFPHSVELAFFNRGHWVTDVLPELSAYADAAAGESRVYAYVPIGVFATFMSRFSGTERP
jgi:hypothetical protein